MACTITITSVQGFNVPGQQVPATIRVNGTATDCEFVVVGLTCHEPPEEIVIQVGPSGNWSVDFVAAQVEGCRCQGDTTVYAFCKADPLCRDEFVVTSLQCEPLGECPQVTGLTASVNGCAGSGNSAAVTFTGTLTPPAPNCTFQWNFGDGTPPVITNTPAATHLYLSPGSYTVTVTAICGTCIRQTSIFITVPVCCPVLTGIAFNVNGCADGKGKSALVTLAATTNPAGAMGVFTWDFGDGSPAVITPTSSVTHSYSNSGSFAVTVTLTPSDPTCPPTTTSNTVSVPPCNPDDDDDDDDEGVGCKAIRFIMTIAAILAILSVLVAICVPAAATTLFWIALGLGILAAIAGIFWAIFCPKPCGFALLFSWQVALGVGFAVLYFTQCCPFMWWVGIGLIAAALGLLALWVKECDSTFCEVMVEMSVAIVAVLLPLLGWLGVIPALQPCINQTVAAILSSLAGAIVIAVAACANNNNSGP